MRRTDLAAKLIQFFILALAWLAAYFLVRMVIGTSELAAGPATWQPMAVIFVNIAFPLSYLLIVWRIARQRKG